MAQKKPQGPIPVKIVQKLPPKKPGGGAPPAPKANPNFDKECLEAHNKYRAMHGVPPLTLNANISKFAKQWADDLCRRSVMEHRKNNKYGENLYFAGGMDVDAEQPVKMWYSEISKYDFSKGQFSPETGHFTALIWKATKEVGIGVARKDNRIWVVANYNPPGNVIGQFIENLPPKI